jgi:hypothetical protein
MAPAVAPVCPSGVVKVIARPERPIPTPATLGLVNISPVLVTLRLHRTIYKPVQLREFRLVLIYRPRYMGQFGVRQLVQLPRHLLAPVILPVPFLVLALSLLGQESVDPVQLRAELRALCLTLPPVRFLLSGLGASVRTPPHLPVGSLLAPGRKGKMLP